MNSLSVVLIGPDDGRRRALARAFEKQQATISGELVSYPNFNQMLKLVESDCDMVVVDLDGDSEAALDLVENICSRSSTATVIVYSQSRDPELLVNCMRAGAREFLSEPIDQNVLAEAVIRAGARRLEVDRQKKLGGRLLVFWGAKGGIGVTTLATNFAIALRRESGKEVALVDLNIELGDIAVVLGLTPRFTVSDALRNPERLDQDFVSSLLSEHKSGVAVLAGPDQYEPGPAMQDGSLGKLLHILRDQFPYVVVDAGPLLGHNVEVIFETADQIYLVTEANIPALRNAQRFISHIQRMKNSDNNQVEVVLNRYDPRRTEIEDSRISKALTQPLKWKVPNDYGTVRRSLNTGAPLALENTPVTRVLYQMAREACGKPAAAAQRKKWGLLD